MATATRIRVIGVAAAGVRPRAAGMVVWSFHDYAVDVQDGPAGLLPVLTSPGSRGYPMDLPWAPEGRAEYNRAAFLNLLGTRWPPTRTPSRRDLSAARHRSDGSQAIEDGGLARLSRGPW